MAVAAGTMVWSVAVLVPAALVLENPDPQGFTERSILAALALGVFCIGCAMALYFRLVQTLGSLGVASQSYLRAGISVLLGIIFLGEEFSALVGIGLAAAILGVAAINLPERKAVEAEDRNA